MTEYHRSTGHGEGILHSRHTHVGEVDYHPKSIHLKHHQLRSPLNERKNGIETE